MIKYVFLSVIRDDYQQVSILHLIIVKDSHTAKYFKWMTTVTGEGERERERKIKTGARKP